MLIVGDGLRLCRPPPRVAPSTAHAKDASGVISCRNFKRPQCKCVNVCVWEGTSRSDLGIPPYSFEGLIDAFSGPVLRILPHGDLRPAAVKFWPHEIGSRLPVVDVVVVRILELCGCSGLYRASEGSGEQAKLQKEQQKGN